MTKKFRFLSFLFYFFLTAFLYFSVVNSFFVSDDFDWVRRAQITPATFENYFLKNTDNTIGGGVYRPLTSLSFLIDYKIWGTNSFGYHLTNLFLFYFSAIFIFWLVFLLSQNKWAAFLSGLVFLVLPNHAEAVSWISGRGDVLTVFFYLAALISYIYFRIRDRWYFLAGSLISFFLALLSKEMAITLPAVIIVYELFWHWPKIKPNWLTLLKQFYPLFLFAAVLSLYFYLRFINTKIFVGFYAAHELGIDIKHYVKTFFVTFFSNFSEAGDRHAAVSLLFNKWWIFFPVILIFISSGYWIIKKWREAKLLAFGALFFVIATLPILPLSYAMNISEGDRFAYLPSVGIAIFAGLAFYFFIRYSRLKILPPVLVAIIIIYLGSSLFLKNSYWGEAGKISQALVQDFGKKVDLKEPQGIVLLTLPDNFHGAQVLRNGWFSAISIFYPDYKKDMLLIMTRINLGSGVNGIWLAAKDGFLAAGIEGFFHGAREIKSADYTLKVEGYDKKISSGKAIKIIFTKQFLEQMKDKKITFLAPFYNTFEVLKLK